MLTGKMAVKLGISVLCLIGIMGCSSNEGENGLYERADELTGGRLGTAVEAGGNLVSSAGTFLKDRLGVDIAGTLGLSGDATAEDYVRLLAERTAEKTGEVVDGIDKGAVLEKAYEVLKLVDSDTKITPEMVNVLVILADGEELEAMDVLKAVLPAEVVEKIDPSMVDKVEEKIAAIKASLSESDKSALTDGIEGLQKLIDELKAAYGG